jgi:hypothetical protein
MSSLVMSLITVFAGLMHQASLLLLQAMVFRVFPVAMWLQLHHWPTPRL